MEELTNLSPSPQYSIRSLTQTLNSNSWTETNRLHEPLEEAKLDNKFLLVYGNAGKHQVTAFHLLRMRIWSDRRYQAFDGHYFPKNSHFQYEPPLQMSCKQIHFQARDIQTLRQENLHTITCVYAHFSADRTEKSGTRLQLFTVTHPHPGCKRKDGQKVEILTCLQEQKPWQRRLFLANTDLLKNTSINTPKLSWLQERNKVAFPPNPWEGLSQLNPPHLDRPARICLKHRLFWR